MLPHEAFQAWYGSHEVDLAWLEKPSRHQFRWRLPTNAWITATRQFSSPAALQKVLRNYGPRDVYIGTSAWLTPVNLPKRSDQASAPPVLIDHLVVFDIDFRPFCYRRLEQARKATQALLTWLDDNEDLSLKSISYSGGKGFHLIFTDNDRTLFSIPEPREREDAVRASRQELLQRVLQQGFPVDPTVTADTRRIIRLPGSLHGTTGWACTRITREDLGRPLKTWVATLPRHSNASKLRYFPYGPSDLFQALKPQRAKREKRKKSKQTPTQTVPQTILQCSTQVVGTKGRSSFMAWAPKRWTDTHKTAVAKRLKKLSWGPVHCFEHLGQTLLLSPRAIPKEQLAKEVANMGWPGLATEINNLGHAWVDVSPALEEEEHEQHELVYTGTLKEAGEGGAKVPWSATHLEMLRRLGVDIDIGEDECSGRPDPALRVVSKT